MIAQHWYFDTAPDLYVEVRDDRTSTDRTFEALLPRLPRMLRDPHDRAALLGVYRACSHARVTPPQDAELLRFFARESFASSRVVVLRRPRRGGELPSAPPPPPEPPRPAPPRRRDDADDRIRVALFDSVNRPMAGVPVVIHTPDGPRAATLDERGEAEIGGLTTGHCAVTFPSLSGAGGALPVEAPPAARRGSARQILRAEGAAGLPAHTGATWEFQLQRRSARVVEFDQFVADDVVWLPGIGFTERRPDSPRSQGIDALGACMRLAAARPGRRVLVVGHGARGRLAAEGVAALLLGREDEWAAVAARANDARSLQASLQFTARRLGWSCDPGPIDGVVERATRSAVIGFWRAHAETFGADRPAAQDEREALWRALFTVYMRLVSPSTLAAVDVVHCGEQHLHHPGARDPSRRGETRRVEVIFLDEPADVTTAAPSRATQLCDGGGCGCGRCELYNPEDYTLNHVALPVALPLPLALYARPSAHDDRAERPHMVAVPRGAAVTLRWEARWADHVQITATSADGGQERLVLPPVAASDPNDTTAGSVEQTVEATQTFTLTASNAAGRAVYHRTVTVLVGAPADAADLQVHADSLLVVPVAPAASRITVPTGGTTPSVEAAVLHFAAAPSTFIPHQFAARAPDLLDFRPGPPLPNPHRAPSGADPEAIAGLGGAFRSYVKRTLLALDNYGIEDKPLGRRDAYLDLVSWDDGSRNTAADRSSSKASSCGLFIHRVWSMLGARGGEMELRFTPGEILKRILAFAGGFKAAHKVQGKPRAPKGNAPLTPLAPDEAFSGADFEPSIGDVIYLFHTTEVIDPETKKAVIDPKTGKAKTVAHNHIFMIAEVVWNSDRTGGTLYSVDGGQKGNAGQDDGSCHSVHVRSREFKRSAKEPIEHINTWIRLDEMWPAFTGDYTEPIRNRSNGVLPHDPSHARIP